MNLLPIRASLPSFSRGADNCATADLLPSRGAFSLQIASRRVG